LIKANSNHIKAKSHYEFSKHNGGGSPEKFNLKQAAAEIHMSAKNDDLIDRMLLNSRSKQGKKVNSSKDSKQKTSKTNHTKIVNKYGST